MISLLLPLAFAGEPVAIGLRGGEQRQGELVLIGEDCSADLIDDQGRSWNLSTETIESAWFLDKVQTDEGALLRPPPGAGILQVQALATQLTLDVGGARFPVQAGDLVTLPPGRYWAVLDAPGCGKQMQLITVEPDVITPLVFNRPTEQNFVLKAIGVGLVWGTFMVFRSALPI